MSKQKECGSGDGEAPLSQEAAFGSADSSSVIASFVERFGCSVTSAQSTVCRHWPNLEACHEELWRKSRPCLIAIEVYLLQREYLQGLATSMLPIHESQLPCFNSGNLTECSKGYPAMTWTEVAERINSGSGIEVFFIDTDAGVPDDADSYEAFYQKKIVREGFADIVAFVTAVDGVVPLVDFLHWRHFGAGSNCCSTFPSLAERDKTAGYQQTTLGASAAGSPRHGTRRQRILLGNDLSTSKSLRQNKDSMQRALRDHGLAHIRGLSGYDVEEMKGLMRKEDIPFPVIVKPVSGAGSEFVTLCYDENDIDVAFAVSQGVQTTQHTDAFHMLLQEYIDGPEYVVNVVSYMGVHVVSDLWKSWKYPRTVTSSRIRPSVEKKLLKSFKMYGQGRMPVDYETTVLLYDRIEFVHDLAKLPEDSEERRVVAYTLRCLDALKMKQGCSHCEVRVDYRPKSVNRGQPVLIELNARMLGDVPRATSFVGYDQYQLMMYLLLSAVSIREDELSRREGGTQAGLQVCRNALPWPPAPQLYNSLTTAVTRHVVFVHVEEVSYLCIPGFRAIQKLPTFKNLTRNSSMERIKPGVMLSVCKTFDLLTSPGAIVMEGAAEDIQRDAAYIRHVENKDLSEWKVLIDEALAAANEVRTYCADKTTRRMSPYFLAEGLSLIQNYEQARAKVFDHFRNTPPPLFIPVECGDKLRQLDACLLICGEE
uniref:Uncharacterized protein TCIL3000_11_8180 n=1 Tax=Trypanosoma congolense (strain IL3000) TaxID=1068625 RepID=G0V147_TRYCI|nr:unnamed protein product [Trypanosoma congolense IL3000]